MIGGKKISGFVVTRNEERNIRDCLESLKWVDELIVVDSYSEDATVEIARRYTDRVVQREYRSYRDQVTFALEQTSHSWVVYLDADERLTQRALDEIHEHFRREGPPEWDAFEFPRKTYFLDRWIAHSGWYPQRRIRLFRKELATFGGRPPDTNARVEGRIKSLSGDILHLSYPGGFGDMVGKLNLYAAAKAQHAHQAGVRPGWWRTALKPLLTLLERLILKRAFLDGYPGLVVAAGSAFYRLTREVKLWEMRNTKEPPPFVPPTMKQDESC